MKINKSTKGIKAWIIRFFGLKGSWKWACKQMDAGYIVRPAHATGTIKLAISTDEQRRIMWTFARDPFNPRWPREGAWKNANIFLSNFEATDWVIWGKAPEVVSSGPFALPNANQ